MLGGPVVTVFVHIQYLPMSNINNSRQLKLEHGGVEQQPEENCRTHVYICSIQYLTMRLQIGLLHLLDLFLICMIDFYIRSPVMYRCRETIRWVSPSLPRC